MTRHLSWKKSWTGTQILTGFSQFNRFVLLCSQAAAHRRKSKKVEQELSSALANDMELRKIAEVIGGRVQMNRRDLTYNICSKRHSRQNSARKQHPQLKRYKTHTMNTVKPRSFSLQVLANDRARVLDLRKRNDDLELTLTEMVTIYKLVSH